ncbi:acyl-[ACP]--phospholipid O-acyltransferase [Rodentibacter caecimuris]|uniref:Acyl-[ACP]--phospholipid O-acyltransferase n=1 Tax=Rodentibacter caecimuris TaxID=1796644 RepID=A0ABX3KX11_9PAST|nr:acyl-[ACP]--phospholipid O-acyltransferase [Rodentibacter heylii]
MKSLLKIQGFFPYLMIAFLNASVDLAHKITVQNVLFKSFEGNTLVILTALINAMILLPFIFLFSPTAFFNNKYSHTKIIRYSSIAAIFITLAIFLSYLSGSFDIAFILTLILAIQSAVYSPAKYSIIKSIVGTERLGRANGIIQALTIIAILFSSFLFSFIFEMLYQGQKEPSSILLGVYPIALSMVVLSMLEAYFAFKIPFFNEDINQESSKFEFSKYIRMTYFQENLNLIKNNKNIWLSIIGLSIFWGVSQIIIAVFPAHYKILFQNDNTIVIQLILAVSGIGLILGSYIAGAMSKYHIEHGIIPVGALGIAIVLFTLAGSSNIAIITVCCLLFGFFGGLLIVPLNATIQYFAQEEQSGKIMAGNNFLQNIAMIFFLLLSVVSIHLNISTKGLFLLSSFVCLIGSFYAIFQLPHLFTRLLLLPILKTGYRFHVEGLRNLPQSGGVLLLGNHISWIDWLVLQAASPRAIKFVMYRGIYNKWYLTWFLKFFKVVPIGAGSSKDSIEKVRELLANGEVVALFPEGHISYNGQINEFQRGFELIIKELNEICIVPFYLRGLWGSSFSRADDYYKSLTKKRGKRDIIVAFGKPIRQFIERSAMRQKVVELSFSSWESFINRQQPFMHYWLDNAKSELLKESVVDSQGMNLTNLKFISAVLVFSRLLRSILGTEKNIGVLLPSSSVGAIINMALFINGKVPVNLNYTLSEQSMSSALKKAEIRQVISAEKFLQKLTSKGFDYQNLLADKVLFIETLSKQVNKSQKTRAFLTALLAPIWWIKRWYFSPVSLSDTATILFSSGSEGEPKGIELSHKNLLTNIRQIGELLNFRKDDVILNSLPIFHSFGLTVTTLLPLCEGIKMVCVPDPTDGAAVGKMAARHNASILFGTSTFFRLYIRNKKLHPLMLQNIRMVVAGAEKLKSDVKEAFRMKFGLDIYEGYGATETAPVAAVNMPNILEKENLKELTFNKVGSVGMALPGTIIKIVDPDSLTELAIGEDGLILIGGGQVMKGYLNDMERTEEVITEIDGIRYYKTGDKGHIDENGFVTIVDRYSRFAKIGGEMISLGSVEEQIAPILSDQSIFTVANVPDEKKGEAVVLLVKSELTEEEIIRRLKASDIPPLMQPSFVFVVEEIPTLASGKVDFKGAKNIAKSLVQNNKL